MHNYGDVRKNLKNLFNQKSETLLCHLYFNHNLVPISVYKIRKIATYIKKVGIYGEMRSGEDARM